MNEVWATLAGAIVGAFATYLGTICLYHVQIKDTKKRFVTALLTEVNAWREHYWEIFGKHIQALKPGEPWTNIGKIVTNQNFFPIYDSNTNKLGFLKPEDIVLVVRAVTLAKGHVESINMAFRQVSEWTTLAHKSAQAGNLLAAERLENYRNQARVERGEALREESVRLIDAVDKAIAALEKYTKR